MGAGRRLAGGLLPAQLPRGEVQTRGHAISILLGFWTSLICDTYTVFTWNRISSSCGTRSSSDRPHIGIQQSGRP